MEQIRTFALPFEAAVKPVLAGWCYTCNWYLIGETGPCPSMTCDKRLRKRRTWICPECEQGFFSLDELRWHEHQYI